MMKIHISIDREDIDQLKLAEKAYGCGGDILSAPALVSWAVQMVIAAYEHEA